MMQIVINHMTANSVWGTVAQLIDTQGTSTFTKNRTRDVSTGLLAHYLCLVSSSLTGFFLMFQPALPRPWQKIF